MKVSTLIAWGLLCLLLIQVSTAQAERLVLANDVVKVRLEGPDVVKPMDIVYYTVEVEIKKAVRTELQMVLSLSGTTEKGVIFDDNILVTKNYSPGEKVRKSFGVLIPKDAPSSSYIYVAFSNPDTWAGWFVVSKVENATLFRPDIALGIGIAMIMASIVVAMVIMRLGKRRKLGP